MRASRRGSSMKTEGTKAPVPSGSGVNAPAPPSMSSIPRTAFRAPAMASITVAGPVTMSPAAKMPDAAVSNVSSSTATAPDGRVPMIGAEGAGSTAWPTARMTLSASRERAVHERSVGGVEAPVGLPDGEAGHRIETGHLSVLSHDLTHPQRRVDDDPFFLCFQNLALKGRGSCLSRQSHGIRGRQGEPLRPQCVAPSLPHPRQRSRRR